MSVESSAATSVYFCHSSFLLHFSFVTVFVPGDGFISVLPWGEAQSVIFGNFQVLTSVKLFHSARQSANQTLAKKRKGKKKQIEKHYQAVFSIFPGVI